jgi:hypothetical protein
VSLLKINQLNSSLTTTTHNTLERNAKNLLVNYTHTHDYTVKEEELYKIINSLKARASEKERARITKKKKKKSNAATQESRRQEENAATSSGGGGGRKRRRFENDGRGGECDR